MAYNKGYNPDALPAHAEPEQAAQMLSQSHPASSSRPPPRTSSYSSKPAPPPPAPVQNLRPQHPDDRYGRPSPSGYGSSDGRQRYNNYDPGPQSPRYGSDPRYGDSARYGDSRYGEHHRYGSPPPQNYGAGGGPPPPGYHGRPPLGSGGRPPPTPGPPRDGNDREALWPLFRAVDKDGSGQLSERELRAALVNGDYTSFDPHTVRMMIRMFDTDRSGSINFDEFCGLWGFLAAWRSLFDRFDVDRSGNISYKEFSEALVAFGYRLSPQFVRLLYSTYDRRGENAISFDLFVQACISLKRMTDVFKKYDEDRDGYITLSFEEFLTGAQSLFLFNSISPVTDTGLY